MKKYYESGIYELAEGATLDVEVYGRHLESEAAYISHRRPQIEAEVKESGVYQPLHSEEMLEIVTESEVTEWAKSSESSIRAEIAKLFSNLPEAIQIEFSVRGLYSEINQQLNDGRYDVVAGVFEQVVPTLSEAAQKEFAKNFKPLFDKLS